MRTCSIAVIGLWLALLAGPSGAAAQPATLADRTAGLERADGFIPLYVDAGRGRLLFEIPMFGEDVLYFVSAATGAGSVELPLDRGMLVQTVIRFERAGGRVLVVEQNFRYRAPDGHDALQANVRESFAQSVLAALPVEAEEGSRVLVDATALVMRDAANIEGVLRRTNQGSFRLDVARSALYAPRTKAFPRNTEVETTMTFAAESPGLLVDNVTPDARSLTLRVHHSFLEAPTGYHPRPADPRIGVSSVAFRDYSRPFSEGTEVRWVTRWRLEKQEPDAPMSEPRTPIVYYLDPAIPEPVRGAMREGVLWWNRAFEAAGFRNAIRVEDPTPDMDPMDIRYAWILWINRDERGFSSGGTYRDPRTGEILGSKTRMDSHRIRTIGNYWESYNPTGGGGNECGMILPPIEELVPAGQRADAMPAGEEEMVLARQALLTAHELGHALGFGHNWASSLNERASVMEYPTPRVAVTPEGRIDLSEAFPEGTGAYDAFMARYAYTELAPEAEADGLEAIVREMREAGILFTPSTDPRYAWYDDRATPTEYLRETMAARRILLDGFGPGILRPGEPIGALRDMRLWMVYLHHRWAIESGLRYVGGMYHNLVLKGETMPATEIVPAALQREILSLLMEAIDPERLRLPERILVNLPPNPLDNNEDLADDYAFDHLRAARILSAMVLAELFHPARAARLVAFADRQEGALTLPEVVDAVMARTWAVAEDSGAMDRSLRRVTQRVALDALMVLGADERTAPEARAIVMHELSQLGVGLADRHSDDAVTEAHLRAAQADIARYLEDPQGVAPAAVAPVWGARPRSRYPLHPGPPLGGRIP